MALFAFQFTPLREGRPLGRIPRHSTLISIHAPPRGATPILPALFIPETISIHAPPRGATRTLENLNLLHRISIHAPPRGATEERFAASAAISISIHAPPRGATGTAKGSAFSPSDFNSRPSARGDTFYIIAKPVTCISIHAPPRGATRHHEEVQRLNEFQFTPLREGRRAFAAVANRSDLFQFTPLREGRPKKPTQTRRCLAFQFTPLREGRRCPVVAAVHPLDISIHAPPRGATSAGKCFPYSPQAISIHAPPRGATLPALVHCRHHRDFNSRPSARGDALQAHEADAQELFQFTPLREGRRPPFAYPPVQAHFNSRPSARGDAPHSCASAPCTISIHAPPRGATAAAAVG